MSRLDKTEKLILPSLLRQAGDDVVPGSGYRDAEGLELDMTGMGGAAEVENRPIRNAIGVLGVDAHPAAASRLSVLAQLRSHRQL